MGTGVMEERWRRRKPTEKIYSSWQENAVYVEIMMRCSLERSMVAEERKDATDYEGRRMWKEDVRSAVWKGATLIRYWKEFPLQKKSKVKTPMDHCNTPNHIGVKEQTSKTIGRI